MTPRQAASWAMLAAGRRRLEMAAQLAIARLGAHGQNEAVQKQLREWDEG